MNIFVFRRELSEENQTRYFCGSTITSHIVYRTRSYRNWSFLAYNQVQQYRTVIGYSSFCVQPGTAVSDCYWVQQYQVPGIVFQVRFHSEMRQLV